jgi:DNA-binding XRE family transcriptional regulator
MLGSVSSPAENLEKIEFHTEMDAAIGSLRTQEKNVIAMRYSAGSTQTQIAEQFDVTTSRICQIEAGAIAQLRSKLGVHAKGVPVSQNKIRPIVEPYLAPELLSRLAAPSDRTWQRGPAASAPARGMRYLLETLPKAISTRPSLKRGFASKAGVPILRVS